MKKISWVTILFAVLLIFPIACTNSTNENECSRTLNPNGDSELAILMRNMTKHLETERKRLLIQQLPGVYPETFEKIRTANPSSPKSISKKFDSFALMYLAALKQYHQTDSKAESITAYNNLVRSCVSCHLNDCPGPIKRIEKMYIK